MTQTQTPPPDGKERNALGETRQRVLVRRAIIVVIVLGCVAGLAVAAARTRRGDDELTTSGSDASGRPSIVEVLQPADGDTLVNQQAQVGIDLTTPYDATLVVDNVQIPEDQLLRRPELSAVYFTPGAGKVIEQLPAGKNCVTAVVRRVDGTPETVAPITWCFNVA